MRKDTANWIALTNYDIETARHMLETGRYLYVVFLCHLALEKMRNCSGSRRDFVISTNGRNLFPGRKISQSLTLLRNDKVQRIPSKKDPAE